jgi:hypothetical protein
MNNAIPATIQTIIDQLGGARIFAMAFSSMSYDDSPKQDDVEARAMFKVAVGGANKAVVVELMTDDTYRVQFVKSPTVKQILGGADPGPKVLFEREGVYANNLRSLVETMTGLYLTL